MKFRTEIEPIPGLQGVIDHSQPVVMLGSCFTDNIGARLAEGGFDVDVNPAGTLFNPLSILSTLERIADGRRFTADDLVRDADGVWHSFDLHSRFSSRDAAKVTARANDRFDRAARAFRNAGVAIITLGSAVVFEHVSGRVVANCHKFPAADFTRVALTLETTVGALRDIVGTLRRMSPGVRVIFTVSPVRHTAYGLHGNQLSKATLLLAVDTIVGRSASNDIIYYPAYEIVNDDLRDYRFYDEDLKHPSKMAVDYIYDHFQSTFFTAATRDKARMAARQARQQAHRPLINH